MPLKVQRGIVVSKKMLKTIVVKVENRYPHPIYSKTLRKTNKYLVHDKIGTCKLGDQVLIQQCRPLSRRKHWVLVQIISKSSLITYLEDNKVTMADPNHVILKFEKDSEKAKIISNVGDGKNYQLSFVIEEQQSAQEYKIFKFLTIFTVSFGLLIMLFIKRLKKLAHGAE